jgi:hypothetical protein
MSEEILNEQSEELEEEQQAVAESSDGEIVEGMHDKKKKLKAAYMKSSAHKEGAHEDEEEEEMDEAAHDKDEDEEEMDEGYSIPKTKAGMIKALYDQLNGMKKAELSDSFGKIMGATLKEAEHEDEDDDEKKMMKAGYHKKMENKKLKKEDLEIDVKDDMDALVGGEDLSEEFKTKAATIFETAVSAKVISEVNQRIEELEEQYVQEITEAKEEHKSTMTEKVDGYLNYVVEEWMTENELAVEKGIRSELVEDFMTGLKTLFTEHYIDIPEEKVDLVDDLFGKVEDLEQKLDESINNNVEMKKELAEFKKEDTLREVSKDLADTEKEKLGKLAEGIDFEDEQQYTEKLEVIKENYFPTSTQKTETITEELENTEEEETSSEVSADPVMSRYVSALTRNNK